MPGTQLFVGSVTRIYSGDSTMIDEQGTETEFTDSDGTLTAQVLNLDGTALTTPAASMTYTAGSAIVNGSTYTAGNWSAELPSTTAIVAGTSYLVEYIYKLTGSTDPDLTKRVQVAAQYAGGT